MFIFDVSLLLCFIEKSMARKSGEISVSMRDRVIFLREHDQSYREIGKTLNLSLSTVRYIIKKYGKTKSTKNKSRSGRPKILTSPERQYIIKQALRNPAVSAQSLSEHLALLSGKTVCAQTIRNVLNSVEIYGRRKPFIGDTNRQKRLEFTEIHSKPIEF